MKPEQNSQALSLSKNGQTSEHLMPVDANKSHELNNKELSPRLLQQPIEPLDDIDRFDEPKSKGLNLRPLWRVVQRNFLLITGVTTIITTANLHSSLNTPQIYEGSFRFLVEPITSEAKLTDPSVLSRNEGVATAISVDYPTLLHILQSPGLLSKVTKHIQAQYPNFNNSSFQNLVVQRVGTNLSDYTKLIEVRYRGEDPTKVQLVLTEIAQEYLKYGLENRKTRISSGVQFIEDQLPRLQKQVSDLQGKMQILQQQYKLTNPASDSSALSEQIRQIQNQKFEAQKELREQTALYTNLQKQLKLANDEVLAASTLSDDPNYRDLLAQIKKIESQLVVAKTHFTENNPAIQSLRTQQKNLSLLLNQEAQKISGQTLPSRVKNPQVLNFQNSTRQALIKQLIDSANNIQVLKIRDRAITKAEAQLNQKLKEFPAIIRQYNDLQQQLEIATNTLNQLLVQRETLRVEAAQKEVPWELVSEPIIPRDFAGKPIPIPSNKTKTLGMGVFVGLLLGIGAALLKEKSSNIFYTTEDIQDAIPESPLLEVTPFDQSAEQLSNYSAVAGSIEKIQSNYSNTSLFLDTFSSLYTSIRFLAGTQSVHSLVVCSAEPRDGKTTIALHLAKAAALMGQRVLLVDGNLCEPQLHNRLGLPNLQGLSNLLSENLEPKELIQRSPLEDNLFVLTAGQRPANSTGLFASAQMRHLIEQFQTTFDLVIYDTPHLLGFTDANFLATHTNGILMVVKLGKTKRLAVKQVLDKLNSFRLPILGIVANSAEKPTNKFWNFSSNNYQQIQQKTLNYLKSDRVHETTLLTSGKRIDDDI